PAWKAARCSWWWRQARASGRHRRRHPRRARRAPTRPADRHGGVDRRSRGWEPLSSLGKPRARDHSRAPSGALAFLGLPPSAASAESAAGPVNEPLLPAAHTLNHALALFVGKGKRTGSLLVSPDGLTREKPLWRDATRSGATSPR